MVYLEIDLSIKDFLPLTGTILTLLAGYLFLTVQVRKNRRAKWIEDFREHAATLISAITSYSLGPTNDNRELVRKSGVSIKLFITEKNNNHLELNKSLEAILTHVQKEAVNDATFDLLLNQFGNSVIAVIQEEQAKI